MNPKSKLRRAPSPAEILPHIILALALGSAASAATITTYAGGGTNGNFSNTIGFPATNASFPGIQGVAVDLAGNLYIAHYSGARVLRVKPTNGLITSFADTGVSGHDSHGGLATDAQFNSPQGVAGSSSRRNQSILTPTETP